MEKVETNINDKLETRMTKIDDDIIELSENIAKTDKKLRSRIDKIEEDIRRLRHKRIQSDTLGGIAQIQPDRRDARKSEEPKDVQPERQMVRSKSWSEEVEENLRNKEKEKEERETYREIEREKERREKEEKQKEEDRRQWTRERRTAPHWTDDLTATVNPPKIDLERKTTVKQKIAVSKWFGCDSEMSEDEDTEQSEEEETWNTVDRKKARKEKLKKQNEKKRRRREEVLRKTQNMIGLGPISGETLEKHIKKAKNDFEKAKRETVREHLVKYYKFNSEEFEQLEIQETKYIEKGDGIIYIAVADKNNIRDIYRRKAECKREEAILKSFVPPQIFKRFVALNKICGERRASDRTTQNTSKIRSEGHRDMDERKGDRGTLHPNSSQRVSGHGQSP